MRIPSNTKTARFKRLIKHLAGTLAILFVLMNTVAALHAYRFTHFSTDTTGTQTSAKRLSTAGKLRTLLTGIDNPRPVNATRPSGYYTTLHIQSNKMLECWYREADLPAGTIHSKVTGGAPDVSRGTVILFHGYGGEKSSLIDKADEFLRLGYNTLLVDFMGSGGSEGDQTTIGFKEAEEVKSCFDYIDSAGGKPIYLFGTSMGAVAILKALHDTPFHPAGIIIECPFGTLYETVCARFRTLGVPAFPMAGLLTAWGGIENGFSAFQFEPIRYAESVDCPCLLLYGEKDEKVSRREIDGIYGRLRGKKELRTYPLAAHENYLLRYRQDWIKDVGKFLQDADR
ncbi:MAG: alpha/beta fold hydrolase [Puia sp.]|nr:alpha/beta fold hydrolase [Puia sp.]